MFYLLSYSCIKHSHLDIINNILKDFSANWKLQYYVSDFSHQKQFSRILNQFHIMKSLKYLIYLI